MTQTREDSIEIEARIKGFLGKEVRDLSKQILFCFEGDILIIKPSKISNDFRNYVEYENFSVGLLNECLDAFEGRIHVVLIYTIWHTGDFYSLDILHPNLFSIFDDKNIISLKIIHKKLGNSLAKTSV